MIYLCIRYTLDPSQLKAFEEYARRWPPIVQRCGGDFVGYFLPTKLAGSTNVALALIGFADLASYDKYRLALMKDAAAIENVAEIEKTGCILNEDRSFVERAPE